jgi:hypothetical protein
LIGIWCILPEVSGWQTFLSCFNHIEKDEKPHLSNAQRFLMIFCGKDNQFLAHIFKLCAISWYFSYFVAMYRVRWATNSFILTQFEYCLIQKAAMACATTKI